MIWDELSFFKKSEFDCRCGCGRNEMNLAFLEKLDELRASLSLSRVVIAVPSITRPFRVPGRVDLTRQDTRSTSLSPAARLTTWSTLPRVYGLRVGLDSSNTDRTSRGSFTWTTSPPIPVLMSGHTPSLIALVCCECRRGWFEWRRLPQGQAMRGACDCGSLYYHEDKHVLAQLSRDNVAQIKRKLPS